MIELSEEQKTIVYTREPFSFVLAGAGSGKTRVIIERINHLLSNGVLPQTILAITFTNKAAEEMRERLGIRNVYISTFHSFCYQHISFMINKSIIDPLELNDFSKNELLSIALYKNSHFKGRAPAVFQRYQLYLHMHNRIDFDDIFLLFIEHVISSNLLYKYIFIDEFQDTNKLQYEVLQKIVKDDCVVMAVGDPNQSIYGFRGTEAHIISTYIKDYKAMVYTLMDNYRSAIEVIDFANYLMHNEHSVMQQKLNINGIVRIVQIDNKSEELNYVQNVINNTNYAKSIGVLYREHSCGYMVKSGVDFLYHNSVSTISIHESKGLEFDVVILLDTNDYVYHRNHETHDEALEEMRLFYVAVTRAKYELHILINRSFGSALRYLKI